MNIEQLLSIVAALRDPETGCPWDKKQDFRSIANYTLEEAYEVIDAIERNDFAELKDELGDLLLQVIFHAQMADEKQLFSFSDVVASICDKMLRRHPHVFGDQASEDASANEQQIKQHWEDEKAKERAGRQKHGVLAGVAKALPALKRAQKLQKRAANVGFDWPNLSGAKLKLDEELLELEQAQEVGSITKVKEELGDVLFSCVNYARHLGLDAESCLLAANSKFEQRFQKVESYLQAEGHRFEDCKIEKLDEIWNLVKRQ